MNEKIHQMYQRLQDLKGSFNNHLIYDQVQGLEEFKHFVEHQVFAVWNYLSLLKASQRNLLCPHLPWLPKTNKKANRYIQELMLKTESDMPEKGKIQSLFQIYLEAMEKLGANTSRVELFIRYLERGIELEEILSGLRVSQAIKEYIQYSYRAIQTEQEHNHQLLAALIFARESLLPEKLIALVETQKSNFPDYFQGIFYYIEKYQALHTDLDQALAVEALEELCADDENKWQEAEEAASIALEQNLKLWDGVLKAAPQTV